MINPIPTGRFSAPFNQPRPFDKPTHIHGALDIAAPQLTPILAPESGMLYIMQAVRSADSKIGMPQPKNIPFFFQGAGYWYDLFGVVIVLIAKDRTHLLCHQFMESAQKRAPGSGMKWTYQESIATERFPAMVWQTDGKSVFEGNQIGVVGNAGYSTGPHLHWEIHPGTSWVKHDSRLDPATFVKEGQA